MKLPGLIVFVALPFAGAMVSRAADATSPVDYAQRNGPFAPAAPVAPPKQAPETNAAVQDKRVDKTSVEKKPAAVGGRRSAIDVQEAREKTIRAKDSHRPEKLEQPMSALNHREASMSTAADSNKPQLITKYQDGLTSASATNMARFPALDRATGAKINRFVFRKNAPDPAVALDGAAITPAAGGATVQKQ
jgi:hypothetical protein